jgi:hypothetical protein
VPAFAAASSSKPAGVAGKCRDGAILETSSRQHRFTPVVVHPCRLVGFGIRTKTSDYKCAADYEQKIERRGDRPACTQGLLIPGSLDDVAALDPTPYRRRPVPLGRRQRRAAAENRRRAHVAAGRSGQRIASATIATDSSSGGAPVDCPSRRNGRKSWRWLALAMLRDGRLICDVGCEERMLLSAALRRPRESLAGRIP